MAVDLIHHYILMPIRRVVYKLGFRPKYGTVLYSPSLSMFAECEKLIDIIERELDKPKEERAWRKKQ